MAKREISIEIKHPAILGLLIILSVFLVFELRVMLNSHIAFGDEGFHTYVAQYMSEHKEYPVYNPTGDNLYKGGFHGPPVFHLLEASFGLLGYNEFILKILTPFTATILLGLLIFVLGKKIFDIQTALIASIITVTVPSIVTYSVLLYRDIIFTFFFTMFSLTLILAIKTEKKKYWIVSGVFCVLTFLTKTPGYAAPLLAGVVFIYRFIEQKNLFKTIKQFLPIGILFVLIASTFILRNLYYYKTPACNFPLPLFDNSKCNFDLRYNPKFEPEGRTHEVGTEASAFKIGLMNYFDFAYGWTWFVPLMFICGLFLISTRKKKMDVLTLFVFLSFLPIIYIAFPGRAEDTSRFMLALVPMIALVSANYLSELYKNLKKSESIPNWIGVIVLLFIDILVIRSVFPLSSTSKTIFIMGISGIVLYFLYVKNYNIALIISLGFIILSVSFFNLSNKLMVMKQVKQFSPAFFEACDWIKENTDKNAMLGNVIWGGATAYNCQRIVGGGGSDVTYSKNLTLALSLLKAQGATHIFIQKFSISWADEKLTEKYPISFVEWMENDSEHFVKVYENGPPLEQCRQVGGCDGTILYELNYTDVKLIPLSDLLH